MSALVLSWCLVRAPRWHREVGDAPVGRAVMRGREGGTSSPNRWEPPAPIERPKVTPGRPVPIAATAGLPLSPSPARLFLFLAAFLGFFLSCRCLSGLCGAAEHHTGLAGQDGTVAVPAARGEAAPGRPPSCVGRRLATIFYIFFIFWNRSVNPRN